MNPRRLRARSPLSLELVVRLVAIDAGGGGGEAVNVVEDIIIVAASLFRLARLEKLVHLLR
jgi:hypothetical protein